jgi:hypothetical protein
MPRCGYAASPTDVTAGGARKLVVSARTPDGGWEPIIAKAATEEAVRMIRGNAANANARAAERAVVRHGRTGVTGQGVLA